jgi:hypothetical protein
MYECRCDERLKNTKSEGSTRRGTGTPKDRDEVRLRDERFVSVMGEYVFLK